MTSAGWAEEDSLKKERIWTIVLLAVVALLTALDIYEDLHEGSSLYHTASEALVVVASIMAAGYLWRATLRTISERTNSLTEELVRTRADAQHWREETAALSRGLNEAIDRQLGLWGLTQAEQEVAHLLLKGLSLKEIAEARATTERTVRQQAAAIYGKSKLEGRAQLAAFFLEDLFG